MMDETTVLIKMAARLVRGDLLMDLYEICEKQTSVSTNRLEKYLDEVAKGMKDEAVALSDVTVRT